MNEQTAAKHRTLLKGTINSERGARNNVLVVDIGGDTDDPRGLGFEARNKLQNRVGPENMPIDRVLIREHASRQRLAHDGHRFFALGVKVVEVAACDYGNAQSRKKAGGYGAEVSPGIFLSRPANMAIGGKLKAGTEIAGIPPGNDEAECGLVYSGECFDAAYGFLIEIHDLLRRFAIGHGRDV